MRTTAIIIVFLVLGALFTPPVRDALATANQWDIVKDATSNALKFNYESAGTPPQVTIGTDGVINATGYTVNNQPRGMVMIQDVVLSGTTAISLTNIPQTYRDLQIIFSALGHGGTGGTNCWEQIHVRFNGDAGASSYDFIDTYTGSQWVPSRHTAMGYHAIVAGWTFDNTCNANAAAGGSWIIPNYTSNLYKTMHGTTGGYGGADNIYATFVGSWRNTAAITSIVISHNGLTGNFKTGTRATLYGIN